jgi:hypothetical protein
VRESAEPLPFAEILYRVNEQTPITTRNPKSTIRNAVGQSRLVVATGDGRYGWKPRLITGAMLRVPLTAESIAGRSVSFGDEVRDALWPSFFEIQKRNDRSPAKIKLPDDLQTLWALDCLGDRAWGTCGTPEFWRWLQAQHPTAEDQLLVTAVDCEARLFAVVLQRQQERDEAVIQDRNRTIQQAALKFVTQHPNVPMVYDVCTHLLVSGQYHHPVPPDSFAELWTPAIYEKEVRRKEERFGNARWMLTGDVNDLPMWRDPFDLMGIQNLFEKVGKVNLYNPGDPPDLPRDYAELGNRRPRLSQRAQHGVVKTFTFRVCLQGYPKVWRDLELAEDQTLEDLHLAIQEAFRWMDDHLYSFFMSDRAWDKNTEIGSPWSESLQHTHQVTLENLELRAGQKFLYLFDYGDGHIFDITVQSINPQASGKNYPRVVGRQGKAPAQY